MNDAHNRLTSQARARVFKLSGWATAILFALLFWIGRPLTVPGISPLGIVSYEFAGTLENARRMVEAWREVGRLHAAFSLGLDYVFMLAYPTFFALLCLRSASRFIGWLARLGNWLAWGQWLAAGLDALENVALLSVLFGSTATSWPGLAFFCATVKFSLIGLALAYWAASKLTRR